MRSALKRYWIQAALIGVAMVWGGTFVMVKDAIEAYPLFSFLGLRFAIAVVAFCVMFPRALRAMSPATWGVGLVAGLLLCAGYIFQTWGLADPGTTASEAAFITGMFVVITPVMQAVVLRSMPRAATIAGATAAVVGLWLLSGAAAGGWGAGETRVLLCAVAYSAHMIVLGGVGKRHDALSLTVIQLATTAIVCGAIALATEPLAWPQESSIWLALGVTGVLASAVAFAVQTYAQRHIPPARTALILITEPAFGGLFGWIAGETLGITGVAGAALILIGMIVSEIVGATAAPEEHVVLESSLEGPNVPLVEPAVSEDMDAAKAG